MRSPSLDSCLGSDLTTLTLVLLERTPPIVRRSTEERRGRSGALLNHGWAALSGEGKVNL